MDVNSFRKIENYMLSCMEDSAHDKEHIYRVLYNALEIAKSEADVNYDILIVASLLHDIGRKEQFENPNLCHAMVGGDKAYRFLLENGFDEEFSSQVRKCIQSHRYRKTNEPESIEAKILFDADKLDATGTMGIARTLVYKGTVSEPLYSLLPDGTVSSGEGDKLPSFFQEYKYKLEKVYKHFYTERGSELAKERRQAAVDFYNNMYNEVNSSYKNGKEELEKVVADIVIGSNDEDGIAEYLEKEILV